MSVLITRSLVCDYPDCFTTYFDLDRIDATARHLREIAIGHGYEVNAPGGKDYCPEHRTSKPRGQAT